MKEKMGITARCDQQHRSNQNRLSICYTAHNSYLQGISKQKRKLNKEIKDQKAIRKGGPNTTPGNSPLYMLSPHDPES